jgi:hypothetical protein
VGIVFSAMFGFPNNAYATCVNYVQSQAIAAAYEGDATPTVHTMDTCGGDDTSYQIPIATTITFDGVQYSNVYATTNSVITFGNPDNTYWTYPNTPSISLYSMDWVSGWYNAPDTLNISYSEGGFQLDLEVIPFGQWNAPTPSNINIIVAITNTGGISVAYSYQGPEYPNLRTGVRLHSGEIVSLEAWGATQIQAGEPTPTLAPEPVPDPTASPTEEPVTPEEQQAAVVEAVTLANDIANLNYLIANINGDNVEEPTPEPTPEPTNEPTEEPELPEPDVEVEPEIVTPEDPRFPDEEEQTEPDTPSPSPSSDTTDEETEDPSPEPEPSEEPTPEPSPQTTDTDPEPTPEPEPTDDQEPVSPAPDNDNTDSNPISDEELKKLNKLIAINDSKLMSAVSNFITELNPEAKKEFAKGLGIKTDEVMLIAEAAKNNPAVSTAIVTFAEKAQENADAPMPYTIADAIVEAQAEQMLADPIGAVAAVFTNIDLDKLMSPSEWGSDMTDDQREKAQEVIIPVILVSNIVNSVMSLRRI